MDFTPFPIVGMAPEDGTAASSYAGMVAGAGHELAALLNVSADGSVRSVTPASASSSSLANVAGLVNDNGTSSGQPQQSEANLSKSASPAPSFIRASSARLEAPSSASPLLSQGIAPGAAIANTPPPAAAAAENPAADSSQNAPFPASSQSPPSPGREPKSGSSAQLVLLKDMISQQDAPVVRQAVRELWQKCLFGSDFHTLFLTNAVFRYAPADSLAKVIDTYGERTVRLAKHQLIKHFAADDFDELADVILSKVSNKFMDRVLARRLETIPAQDLVNALARAERLGYDLDDVVEGGKLGAQPELVIPSRQPVVPLPVPSSHIPPPTPSQIVHKTAFRPSPSPAASRTSSSSIAPPATPSAVAAVPGESSLRGVQFCEHCHRPCTTTEALLYHYKKVDCKSNNPAQTQGRDSCVHCGTQFTSSQGIQYHTKSGVCGHYSAEATKKMIVLLQSFKDSPSRTPQPAMTPVLPNQAKQFTPSQPQPQTHTHMYTPTPTPTQSQPHKHKHTYKHTPKPAAQTPRVSEASPMPSGGPYAHLTPQQRQAFEAEMTQTEQVYGEFFKQAMMLPTKKEQDEEFVKLKNRFNTKQSTTRKKYGIRLRERRTAADMEAERERLFGTGNRALEQPAKRVRLDSNAQTAVPLLKTTAPDESPRRRVPVKDMGGLSGSQATAELVDPTALLTPSQPPRISTTSIPLPATATATKQAPNMMAWANRGTSDDPMQIDDDNSDLDSDDDIPAKLPAAQST